MAGGKGSRLKLQYEKPLIPLYGKPLIEWVIETLHKTPRVREIYVAVSKNTPNTRRWSISRGLKVIETMGKGLVFDIVEAVSNIGGEALTIMADLPLITPVTLETIIEIYQDMREIKRPKIITVLTPIEDFKEYADSESLIPYPYLNIDFQPTGVSIFNLEGKDEIVIIAGFKTDFININTINELKIAERILCTKYMEEMCG